MVATYVRPPPMMVKGEGCYLWDVENRRYLDFTAGIAVNSLGHADPEMIRIISQQVRYHIRHRSFRSKLHLSVPDLNTRFKSLPQSMDW